MTQHNVVAFPSQRVRRSVSTLTEYEPNGWLEISPDVYDWFVRNPAPPMHVNQYGFLHAFTHRAFVCIKRSTGDDFLCGMSNRIYTLVEFDQLSQADNIDAVIEALGYEPIALS